MVMGESLDLPGFPTMAGLKAVGKLSCGGGECGCTAGVHAGLHIFTQIILSCWNVAHTDCFLSLILSLFICSFLVHPTEQCVGLVAGLLHKYKGLSQMLRIHIFKSQLW